MTDASDWLAQPIGSILRTVLSISNRNRNNNIHVSTASTKSKSNQNCSGLIRESDRQSDGYGARCLKNVGLKDDGTRGKWMNQKQSFRLNEKPIEI